MKNSTIAWLTKHNLKRPAGFYSPWESFYLEGELAVGDVHKVTNNNAHLKIPVEAGKWHAKSYNRSPKEDFDFVVDDLSADGKQLDAVTDPVEQVINQITHITKKFENTEDVAGAILDLGVKSTEVAILLAMHWPGSTPVIKRTLVELMFRDRVIKTKYTEYIAAIENLKKEEWLTKCMFFAIVHDDYINDPRFQIDNIRKTIKESTCWKERVEVGYFLGLFDADVIAGLSNAERIKFIEEAKKIANRPYNAVEAGRYSKETASIKHMPNSGVTTGLEGFVIGCPWSDSSYTLKIIRNDEGNIIFIGSILYDEQ